MAKNITLLKHNEIAYQKLVECLKHNNLVAIDHATGTGKSFILLKYLYENRDKRILFLAPTYPIIDQLINNHMNDLDISFKDFNKLDSEIYANINKYDIDKLVNGYDIVILDEYHRCGARKWSIGINKLIDKIKNNHKDKVVIGTTATEIRYLDNEKNMNNILFDGVVASKLTLADAILQGILPVFNYCNYPYLTLDEIDKLKSKIERNYNTNNEYIEELNKLYNQIENMLLLNNSYTDFLQKAKKMLVFSSSIDNIKKDKVTVRRMLKDKNYQEYSITYMTKKEDVNKILDIFREKNDNENKVLYCINILNEGVHVKDVDAIIMLRSTVSPIIYFQQLGRLLSCSRDKDEVCVFDLVHNIRNNRVIYDLYNEVISRAKELLKTDVENKDRYEHIINNFKIAGEYGDIYKRLDYIKSKTTRQRLISLKIDDAIKTILEARDDLLVSKAIIDIFHYQEYIGVEQFSQIEKLNIVKPSIFKYTLDEFKNIIGNFENIKEKISYKYKSIYSKVKNFYNYNGRLPQYFSNDNEEKQLAKQLIKLYDYLDERKQGIITSLVQNNLSYVEKLTYNKNIENVNMKSFYKEIEDMINNNVYISVRVIDYLEKNNTVLNRKIINLIRKYNDYSYDSGFSKNDDIVDKSEDSKMLKEQFKINKNILYSEVFAEVIEQYRIEYADNTDKNKYLELVAKELIEFLKENKRMPNYDNENEIRLYIKELIFRSKLKESGYYDAINEMLESIQQEKKEKALKKILSFMDTHNGLLPSRSAYKDKEERELGSIYLEYIDSLDGNDNIRINEVRDKYHNYQMEVIRKYINFIKINGRLPNRMVEDENEQLLLDEYDRVKDYLTEEEKYLIEREKSNINKYQADRKLYRDVLIARENNDGGNKKR